MYKVQFITHADQDRISRQTKGYSGISNCGKYQFYLNGKVENPDFLIVQNKWLKKNISCNVAPENTILLITEPRSVVNFPKKYRDQFGLVCSCQGGVRHKNVIHSFPILPWYIGGQQADGTYLPSYDMLKNGPAPQKTKLISVITSNKVFTKGHQDRIRFVEKLKAYYGDKLDVYGRGFNDFKDKWDVIVPYKYHIVIENSAADHYWTEKLSDCYLAGTFPIYYGCTNVHAYFPENAYKTIDIYDFEAAVSVIDAAIANEESGKNQLVLQECKQRVLDDYNLVNVLAKYCDGLNPDAKKERITLKPSITILDWYNLYLYTIKRNFYLLKAFLGSVKKGKALV